MVGLERALVRVGRDGAQRGASVAREPRQQGRLEHEESGTQQHSAALSGTRWHSSVARDLLTWKASERRAHTRAIAADGSFRTPPGLWILVHNSARNSACNVAGRPSFAQAVRTCVTSSGTQWQQESDSVALGGNWWHSECMRGRAHLLKVCKVVLDGGRHQ